VQAAAAAGAREIWASFILEETGQRLLGGDALPEAARACLAAGARGVGVNCVHADVIDRALPLLLPFGAEADLIAYANSARMHLLDSGPVWEPDDRPVVEQAAAYGRRARAWARAGVTIIGSCCGTTPEHIRAVAQGILPWPQT
jgi:homocysteine S-methyltransferase